MVSNRKKIIFLFAHLLENPHFSGGDEFGYKMAMLAKTQNSLDVCVLIPAISKRFFKDIPSVTLRETFVDTKIFNPAKVYTIFPLYISRLFSAFSALFTLKVDTIYTTGDFLCDVLPAYLYSIWFPKTKWLALIHHLNPNPFERKNPFFRSMVSFCLQRLSLYFIKKRADIIFTPSEHLNNSLIMMGFKNKIITTGTGLDVQVVTSRKRLNSNNLRSNNLVFFGRLNETKGVFDLPYVFSSVLEKHPDLHLNIIGSYYSSTKNKLSNEFKSYNCLEKVTFYGFIKERTEVYKLLDNCSVLLFPSYEEGWGITVMESILCDVYPVVYKLPVFAEIFGDSISSVSIGDRSAFVQEVLRVLSMPKEEYTTTMTMYKQIIEKYDWNNIYKVQSQYFK